MKFYNLILATVVLLVLMGTMYWSDHRKPNADAAKDSADTPPAILKLDSGTITKVELKNKDAEPLVLDKNTSGTWQITQPKPMPADQIAVSNALSTLSSLNSERLVDDKVSDVKQFGFDPPAAEIDVTEKDNKSQKLLIGNATTTGNAIYAMLAGDPRLFTMPSYEKTSIDKSMNDLRDKRLITMDADKMSRIDLERKNQDIEFGRSKDEWQILKPKPLRADDMQVGDLARKLADAKMDLSGSDASGNDAASAFAHATPVATAKVTDQSGTQELQIRKNKDTYYAKSSVVDGAYKVDASLATALDKNLDDFRNKKVFDFGFNDPDKVEMHSGPKAYFLTKGGNDWWSGNGKKMDPETAETFISQLRDLSASKFVETGFANPTIELTITSDKGKQIENVAIAKDGKDYIAKRSNDPTLYELDASSIDELQKAADGLKPATTGK
ncbi:MAG TPA: DUF4340 domain-containing protein [Candidatus Aquilonibacter sp.]|nr:DUF4340 domain-containing protein [Candidatus Aquilonibacter sp.]